MLDKILDECSGKMRENTHLIYSFALDSRVVKLDNKKSRQPEMLCASQVASPDERLGRAPEGFRVISSVIYCRCSKNTSLGCREGVSEGTRFNA